MRSRSVWATLCAVAITIITVAQAASNEHAQAAPSSLLSSLRHYEVVSVVSSSHALQGPPAFSTMATTPTATSAAAASPPAHPDTHALSFEAHGHRFDVVLVKNAHLFSPRYSESRQHWDEHGVRRRDLEAPAKPVSMIEHCYYHGKLVGGFGDAALHTCDHGFSGMIRVKEGALVTVDARAAVADAFIIEPAHAHLSRAQLHSHAARLQAAQAADVNPHALHIVYRMKDASDFNSEAQAAARIARSIDSEGAGAEQEEEIAVPTCGVDHPHVKQQVRAPQQSARKSAFPHTPSKPAAAARYIELFVANDRRRFQALGQTTESRSAAITNIISNLYANTAFTPTTLAVTLIGQTTFFVRDPWNLTLGSCAQASATEMCVDTLLTTWNQWRRNPDNTQPYQNNDAGHLFSGYDFQSSVLGYAGVGSMCLISNSGGINQMSSANDAFNAAVAAHEIGHNLGMQHDSSGNTCASSGFIMNAVVNPSAAPSAFSTCSLQYYSNWAASSGSCLNNVPTSQYGDPVCGNGFIEAGEACDCGPYPSGQTSFTVSPTFCSGTANPCCDAMSCQFLEEAECSETDACCLGCKVAPASANIQCRASANTCDLPEVCDGTSAACPFDENIGNGAPCTLTTLGGGACFEGDCTSYAQQCNSMNQYFAGGPWIPSPSAEASNAQLDPPQGLCGRLICTTEADLAAGLSPTAFNLIEGATPTLPYFTVNDGVPCGSFEGELRRTDSLCYGRQCVSAPETNVRYYWKLGAWAKCSDCDTFQDRNITCTRVSNDQTAPEDYCSAQGKPSTRQQCNDDELLCEHSLGGSITLSIMGTKLEINSAVVIGTSCGIFVFLLLALHGCVKCAAKTELDDADREADARAERKAEKAGGARAKSPQQHQAKKRAVANKPAARI